MSDELFGIGFLGFFMAFALFFIVMFFVAIVLYVLQAIGLFKIAKNDGKNDLAWLAWIPVVNSFLLMILVEDEVHEDLRGKVTLFYGIAFVVSIVIGGFIPFLAFIPLVMIIYAFYFLSKRYSENPVMHMVIAIITIGMSIPVQIFIFRNSERIVPQIIDHPTE